MHVHIHPWLHRSATRKRHLTGANEEPNETEDEDIRSAAHILEVRQNDDESSRVHRKGRKSIRESMRRILTSLTSHMRKHTECKIPINSDESFNSGRKSVIRSNSRKNESRLPCDNGLTHRYKDSITQLSGSSIYSSIPSHINSQREDWDGPHSFRLQTTSNASPLVESFTDENTDDKTKYRGMHSSNSCDDRFQRFNHWQYDSKEKHVNRTKNFVLVKLVNGSIIMPRACHREDYLAEFRARYHMSNSYLTRTSNVLTSRELADDAPDVDSSFVNNSEIF